MGIRFSKFVIINFWSPANLNIHGHSVPLGLMVVDMRILTIHLSHIYREFEHTMRSIYMEYYSMYIINSSKTDHGLRCPTILEN
jgi:hypothetical protein